MLQRDDSPGFRRLFAGVLMGIFLGAVDATIVTTALPAIARQLHGLEHLSWIVVAYLLTSTATTLVYGKLSDLYGRRPLMLMAVAGFAATSVLCALAQDVAQLIAARALQGIFGGGLFVLSQAMLADRVSPRERGRYQAWTTSVWAVASAAGPFLGGFFVDHLSWEWCFWVNVPLCAIALLIFARTEETAPRVGSGSGRLDYAGILLFMGGVTSFLLFCTWAGTQYAWLSVQVLGALALSLLLFGLFVPNEFRASQPILPPHLFKHRTIVIANVCSFANQMLILSATILVPVYLQLVRGVSASTSGALLIPYLTSMSLTSWYAGQHMRRTGQYKSLMPISFVVVAASYALLALLGANSSPYVPMLDTLLLGLGVGILFPVMITIAQNAASPADTGAAVSTITFSRSLGGAFGSAIFWSILLSVLSTTLDASGLDEARRVLLGGGRNDFLALPPGERATLVGALVIGFHAVFAIGAGVALAAAGITLFVREEVLRTGDMITARRIESDASHPPRGEGIDEARLA